MNINLHLWILICFAKSGHFRDFLQYFNIKAIAFFNSEITLKAWKLTTNYFQIAHMIFLHSWDNDSAQNYVAGWKKVSSQQKIKGQKKRSSAVTWVDCHIIGCILFGSPACYSVIGYILNFTRQTWRQKKKLNWIERRTKCKPTFTELLLKVLNCKCFTSDVSEYCCTTQTLKNPCLWSSYENSHQN